MTSYAGVRSREPRRMPPSLLRAGVVGAGLMGQWHAHAAARAGARLVGISDRDRAAAGTLAARWNARSFASTEELLSLARPDVLHVCTPLGTHQALAELAIDAGVHLLVEKPLTDQARATEALYARAASSRVLLAPVHQYMFQDGVRTTVWELASLGRPIHLQAVFCSAGAGSDGELEAAGDRVAADILPHPLSVVEAIWPGSLACADWVATRPAAGELRAHAMLGSATLSVLVSMSARPTRAGLWLTGTRGSMELDLFHGFALRESGAVSRLRKAARPFDLGTRLVLTAARNLGHRALAGVPAYPGLNELVRAFYTAIKVGGPCPISAESTIAVAHARERILTAAGLRTMLDAELISSLPVQPVPTTASGF